MALLNFEAWPIGPVQTPIQSTDGHMKLDAPCGAEIRSDPPGSPLAERGLAFQPSLNPTSPCFLEVAWRNPSIAGVRLRLYPSAAISIEFQDAHHVAVRSTASVTPTHTWETLDFIAPGCQRLILTGGSHESPIARIETL